MGKRKVQAAGGGGSNKKKGGRKEFSDDEADYGTAGAAVEDAVQLDLADASAAARVAAEAAAANDEGEGSDGEPAPRPDDPYLLADAAYIQKDTRWRNKQRTLVFCSRGVTSRFRHVCEDIKKMLPHHKTEPKFDKKSSYKDINEICEMKSCNNFCFFEARKMEDLYLWVGRCPSGPTMKFQVLNIHTTSEVRLAGNCLLGSRPILHFDKHFNELSYLKLMKGMFIQAFGTPRNHPKSKPFHDHVMSFYYMDRKIWFRHYQVSPETPGDVDNPERQTLTEIGPRFVLDPVLILSGSFGGQILYKNPFYMSPTALRSHAKKLLKSPYRRKLETKAERKQLIKDTRAPEDPTNEVFE